MGWLVTFSYLIAYTVLVATGNLWCLLVAGLVMFAALVSVALTLARQHASEDSSDDVAEDFGGSFRGHGASDE